MVDGRKNSNKDGPQDADSSFTSDVRFEMIDTETIGKANNKDTAYGCTKNKAGGRDIKKN